MMTSVDKLLLVATPVGRLAVALCLGVLGSCSPERPVVLSGAAMGTTWSVQIVGPGSAGLADAIQARLDRINGLMTTYDADSEVALFNAYGGTDWVAVSPELLHVVNDALRVAQLTGGAFDVTAGPLVELWGFGASEGPEQLPNAAAIATALDRVGSGQLQARSEPAALRKLRPSLALDLSAIAKGYGVDEVANLLDAAGIAHYLVEIGGELKSRGRNARGEIWTIAVEKPTPDARRVQRAFPLHDLAVATSGDYRNFFEVEGKRYSHTIDPRNGYPVAHGLASVTVLDTSAMSADALATGLLVLGEEAGFEFALVNDVAALFVVRGREGFSERMTPRFTTLMSAG